VLNYTDNPLKKVDTSKIFKYMLFLRGRFSNQFISFLCQCLKLSNKKRATMADLLGHPFLTSPTEPKNIRVNLVDLLKISRGWC
jgi:serine/threonine protein kinase